MLTDAQIKAARTTGARYQLKDGKVPGLTLRIGAEGLKTWSLLYYYAGTRRRINLGRWPAVGLKDARARAADVLTDVRHGKDPEGDKVAARAVPTLAEAVPKFLDAIHVAPGTLTTYRGRLTRHVLPALGRRRITDVTLADVRALHTARTKAGFETDANRIVETLRAFYSWARVEWPEIGLDKNPARYEGFRKNPERRRERLWTAEERAAILETAQRMTKGGRAISPLAALAVEMIAVTGMRPMDVVTMQHERITRMLGARPLWIHTWDVSGAGRTKKAGQRRTLNSAAQDVIARAAAITAPGGAGTGWVFPTTVGTQNSSNQLARTFRAIRKAAGLPDELTLYGCRHTYISDGVMAGIPLAVMGADVDNASAVSRYAHLQRAVDEGVSERVLAVQRGNAR